MKSRNHRKERANETLLIIGEGEYTAEHGKRIELKGDIAHMTINTQLYVENQLSRMVANVLQSKAPHDDTIFSVSNETTLEGVSQLVRSGKYMRVGVLNFASAKNPGGGFLNGSLAQEESLAVASALYQSLIQCHEGYYDYHRNKNLLYSDRMIYTPDCPVFRDDDGVLLNEPYYVDFVTSAAPNIKAMREDDPLQDRVLSTFQERSEKVLALFAEYGCDAIVLGAWGCGVFGNDPSMVAEVFAKFLKPGGKWYKRFRVVRFSVLAHSRLQDNFVAFKTMFQ